MSVQHAPRRGALPASYYTKIKLGTISPARCPPPVGRKALKLGMWVVPPKGQIEPRGFGDCGPPSRARRRKHAFCVQLTMVNPVKPVNLAIGHDRIKPTAQADQRSNDTALLIMHEHGEPHHDMPYAASGKVWSRLTAEPLVAGV